MQVLIWIAGAAHKKNNGAVRAPLQDFVLIGISLIAYQLRCDEFLDMVDMAIYSQGEAEHKQHINAAYISVSVGHILTTAAAYINT